MNKIILSLILISLNYLIGSISSAVIISKYIKRVDIRKIGYKTAGGSNVAKNIGVKWGIIVGIFDILKGIPVVSAAEYFGLNTLIIYFIGISAVIGHCWPIWFKFSGGRGIATLLGIIAVMTTRESIAPIIIFISTLPFYLLKNRKPFNLKIFSSPFLVLTALVVYLVTTIINGDSNKIILSCILLFIVLLRRTSARIGEYKTNKPLKLFFSRLIFDNNNSI